jgi:hypothetical protein
MFVIFALGLVTLFGILILFILVFSNAYLDECRTDLEDEREANASRERARNHKRGRRKRRRAFWRR